MKGFYGAAFVVCALIDVWLFARLPKEASSPAQATAYVTSVLAYAVLATVLGTEAFRP